MNFLAFAAASSIARLARPVLMCVKANVHSQEEGEEVHTYPTRGASLGPRKLRPHGVIPFS